MDIQDIRRIKLSHRIAVITLALAMLTFPIAGAVSILISHDSMWVQTAKVTPNSSLDNDDFGDALALTEKIALVGDPGSNSVAVYERTGDGGWDLIDTLTPPHLLLPDAEFGAALAYQDDKAIISAPRALPPTVFVYEGTPDGYNHVKQITSGQSFDGFGESIDVHEDHLVIGAPSAEIEGQNRAGAIHIFQNGPEGWAHESILTHPTPSEDDWLGYEVGIDHETIIATSIGPGNAHLFERSPNGWGHSATIAGTGHARSIAISGETIVVGHPSDSSIIHRHGAATVHQRLGDGWGQVARLLPEDLAPMEELTQFGKAVDIQGDTILIGAGLDDASPGLSTPVPPQRDEVCWNAQVSPSCAPPGAAYLFKHRGEGWEQTNKFTPLDQPPAHIGIDSRAPNFGGAVALAPTADHLLVGAPDADVLPDDDAGAAYAFSTVSEAVDP